MKKIPGIVLGIVLVGIVVFAVFFIFHNKKIAPAQNSAGGADQSSYATSTITASTTVYAIAANYPVFKQASPAFNASIYALIQSAVEDFKQSSTDNRQAMCDTGDDCDLIPQFDFQSSFDVIQSNAQYISVVVSYYGFDGGAHGYQVVTGFNYDVKAKKVLTLADVIHGPYPYDAVSQLSRPALIQQFTAALGTSTPSSDQNGADDLAQQVDEGTTPDPKNFTFTFTDTAITLYFQEYQVGPYSFGQPDVTLKRADLDAAAQTQS